MEPGEGRKRDDQSLESFTFELFFRFFVEMQNGKVLLCGMNGSATVVMFPAHLSLRSSQACDEHATHSGVKINS
jgi:hypothetical protein